MVVELGESAAIAIQVAILLGLRPRPFIASAMFVASACDSQKVVSIDFKTESFAFKITITLPQLYPSS
tara:strand:- start:71 stop:274 length:204 start_codon:yes stop_codon:yes gene_type:complete